MSCSRPCRCAPSAEPGVAVPVDVRFDYLVCTSELCVPERANLDGRASRRRRRHARPGLRSLSPGAAAAARRPGPVRAHRRAIAPRHPAAGDDRRRQPLFLSGYARCSRSFRGAERLAQRRPADRRNRGWPPGGLARVDRGRARDWTGRRPRPDRGPGEVLPPASRSPLPTRNQAVAARQSCSPCSARCSAACCSTSCPACSRSSA